jgi:FMN phosphatase YigB (HAD superfamily)
MIKNLILDMGGVILDVDYTKVVTSFKELGIKDFETIYTQSQQLPIIDKFECGDIKPEEFRQEVRKAINKDLSDKDIDKAWNSMIIAVKKDVIALVGQLKLKYKNIYLFSNTNDIHMVFVRDLFQKELGFDIFSCLFSESFLSNEIHKRKPNKDSFLYVIEQTGINKEETLFIDDTLHNVQGAKEVGLNAYHLTNKETLIDLYNKHII